MHAVTNTVACPSEPSHSDCLGIGLCQAMQAGRKQTSRRLPASTRARRHQNASLSEPVLRRNRHHPADTTLTTEGGATASCAAGDPAVPDNEHSWPLAQILTMHITSFTGRSLLLPSCRLGATVYVHQAHDQDTPNSKPCSSLFNPTPQPHRLGDFQPTML